MIPDYSESEHSRLLLQYNRAGTQKCVVQRQRLITDTSCDNQTNGGVDTSQTQRRAREMVQGRAGNGAKQKTSCKQTQLSAKDETGDNSATAEPIVKLAIEGVSANFALRHTVRPAGLCECKG